MASARATTTTVVGEPKPALKPLQILALTKQAQQKHGLRHDNYQRYRGYCARRIERIRKSLKFTNQYKCLPNRPAKFVARTITEEMVADIRYLEIVMFELERNWAYAMQYKFECMDEPLLRKKFNMRQKLRKAVKWASFLEHMVEHNELVQSITKLESKAYCEFMRASLALELKEWKSASEHFDTARSNYAALLQQNQNTEYAEIYANKLREVEKLLKLCRSESGDADALLISTVSSMNLNESEADDAGAGQKRRRQTADAAADNNNMMEVDDEELKGANASATAQKHSRKERKKKAQRERSEPKPMKPFFFDLAYNFVKKDD